MRHKENGTVRARAIVVRLAVVLLAGACGGESEQPAPIDARTCGRASSRRARTGPRSRSRTSAASSSGSTSGELGSDLRRAKQRGGRGRARLDQGRGRRGREHRPRRVRDPRRERQRARLVGQRADRRAAGRRAGVCRRRVAIGERHGRAAALVVPRSFSCSSAGPLRLATLGENELNAACQSHNASGLSADS